MKKIIFAVMAVVAIGFSACGNKTQQGEAVDSVALIDSMATEFANEDINTISGLLEAGDVAKLQETLANVKQKIATLIRENPELAKEYVEKVQGFLKENADKVKAVVGDSEAAVAAVAAVTEVDPDAVVKGLLEQVGDAATEVKDAAVDAANQKVEEAKDAANQKVEETKAAAEQKIEDQKNATKKKASDAIDNAAAATKNKLGL
jgi:thioesterase domain-containing protein